MSDKIVSCPNPIYIQKMKRIIFILMLSVSIAGTTHAQNWLKLLNGTLKAGKALTISDSELADAVSESIKEMDKSNSVCPESNSYTKRLRHITQGMTKADGIPLNFKVYRNSEVNAFACPDGSIRVYTALMDILTDEELLGVIGHEIGHIALRHSKKAWKDALLRSAASDAIGAFSDTWSSLSSSALGDIAEVAISAKHSRKQENEADNYGYSFLKKCGKNPWAIGAALIKMKELSESNESRFDILLKPFSSHPDFDERIENIRKKAKKDGYSCR